MPQVRKKKKKAMERTTGSLTVGGAEWVDTEKHLARYLVVKCLTYFYSTFR